MKLSRLTVIYGLFIVVSASFTRQILDFFYAHIGKDVTITIFGACFILIFLVILWGILRLPLSYNRKIFFLIVFASGLYLGWSMKIVAERIHILEYGLLGYLASRDLFKNKVGFKSGIFILLIIAIFAFLDEGFQRLLPYRVYDLRDIVFNLAGGIWGGCLFLIKKQGCSAKISP